MLIYYHRAFLIALGGIDILNKKIRLSLHITATLLATAAATAYAIDGNLVFTVLIGIIALLNLIAVFILTGKKRK